MNVVGSFVALEVLGDRGVVIAEDYRKEYIVKGQSENRDLRNPKEIQNLRGIVHQGRILHQSLVLLNRD